jgi:hypothetical protein
LDDLARIWLDADSAHRRLITAATDQIDSLLASDPEHQGESRSGNRRILFVPSLVVVFSVDTQHSLVRVLHVWSYGDG